MFNLLIVDDEPLIVEGLATLDWKSLNIAKLYKATSGEQALNIIRENPVDIVITDIRMPDMSGLEMIKSVSKGRVRKYIILSGYAEFEYAKQAIHLSVCEYLLKPVADEEIMSAVSNAIQLIRKDRHFFNEIMNKMPPLESDLDVTPFDILYKQPQLIDLLNYGNWETAEKRIIEIFAQLKTEIYCSTEFILQAYFLICNTFTHFSHQHGYFLTDMIGDKFNHMHDSAYSGSIKDLENITMDIFGKIKTNLKKDKSSIHQTIVDQVNHYVDVHLNKDIYLQEVADYVFLHPAYLSKIYKTETGKSFSDFVFTRKMEEAAAHLKKSNEKIYKIAQDVGYKDASYFIRKFKEYYGITPQEYRFHN